MREYLFSASQLETFRWHRDSGMGKHDDLMLSLTAGTPQTPAMAVGSAYHHLMELWAAGATRKRKAQGYTFVFPKELDYRFEFPNVVERRTFMNVDTDLIISGQYDALVREKIIDYKTGLSPPRWELYMDSMQWRTYLTLTGKTHFEYVHIQLGKVRGKDKTYQIKGQSMMSMYSYWNMSKHVFKVARELRDFCKKYGIAPDQVYRKMTDD